jgi:hypothetical protein
MKLLFYSLTMLVMTSLILILIFDNDILDFKTFVQDEWRSIRKDLFESNQNQNQQHQDLRSFRNKSKHKIKVKHTSIKYDQFTSHWNTNKITKITRLSG